MRPTAIIVATLAGLVFGEELAAQRPASNRLPDFTPILEVAELLPPAVKPRKDDKTGFVVGGKNATELIEKLTEINGLPIAKLEADMRPRAKSDVGSMAGFLGKEEKLLDVLVADNRYVVDKLGLTHQALARHLHAMATIGEWQQAHRQDGAEFSYHGKRFKVKVLYTIGSQPSPFRDGTASGAQATVRNLDNGKKLYYGLLVPYMVERYGFYEGKGTSFRLEPSAVVEVFDFLSVKKK